MSTITSLGFNILSTYDGAGVAAAKADIIKLQEEIGTAAKEPIRIGVIIDDAGAVAQLNELRASMVGQEVAIRVTANTAEAKAGLDSVTESTAALGSSTTRLTADFATMTAKINESLESAGATSRTTGEAMVASNTAVIDSVQRLAVAQQRLVELQDSGTASASRLMDAENGVAAAQQRLTDLVDTGAAAAQREVLAMQELTASSTDAATAIAAQGAANEASIAKMDGGSAAAAGLGSKLNTVGKVSAVAFGIGLIDAANSAGDLQNSLIHLVTDANETESNMDMVTKGVQDMARETGTSAVDMGNALYHLESSGYHGADGLTAMKAAAEGAKVGNAQLETTTQALARIMYAMHDPASNATADMNAMIESISLGDVRLEDLAGSMGTLLPAGERAGIGLNQLLAAMSVMTAQGEDANNAATHLRQTILQLENPTLKARNEMENLGLNYIDVAHDMGDSSKGLIYVFQEMEDAITNHLGPSGDVYIQNLQKASKNTEDFQKAMDQLPPTVQTQVSALADMVGGTRSFQAVLQLTGENLQTFKDDADKVGAAMQNAGSDVKDWDLIQNTFNQKLSELKQSLQQAATTLGMDMLPALTSVAGAFASTADFLDRHKILLDALMITLGTITAAWIGYKVAMSLWTAASGIAEAAMWALNLAMDANPIGIIVVAVGALVAGIVWLATKTQFFQTVWAAMCTAAKATWQALVDAWQTSVAWISEKWDQLTAFLSDRWSSFTGSISGAWNGVRAAWDTAFASIKNAIGTVVDWIAGRWRAFVDGLKSEWDSIGNALKTAWNDVWFAIKFVAAAAITSVIVIWQETLGRFMPVWNAIWGALKAAWDFAWDHVKQYASDAWNWLTQKWDQFTGALKFSWDVVSGYLSQKWNEFWGQIKQWGSDAWNWLSQKWQEFTDKLRSIYDAVAQYLSDKWQAFWGQIKQWASDAWNWLAQKWQEFTDKLRSIYDAVAQYLSDKWNAFWGQIKQWASDAWDWLSQKWQEFSDKMRSIYDAVAGYISDKWNAFWDAVKQKASDIWADIRSGFEEFKSGVEGTIQGLVDKVRDIWNGITGIFRGPVEDVKKIWNGVAGKFGLPQFAVGGEVEGHATGGAIYGSGGPTEDRVPAWLSNGEHVWTSSEVQAVGGHSAMYKMRENARRGNIDRDNSFAGGGAVDALNAATDMARSKGDGRAYVYGGSGPDGFDCSGYMSAIYNVLTGSANIWQRAFTTEANFTGLGFNQGLGAGFSIGVHNGGGGPDSHMAGTLQGVNVESGGPHNSTMYGGSAAGADNPEFEHKYVLPIVNGQFVSGGMGGSSGPSAEQIAAHDQAVAGIRSVIFNTLQTTASMISDANRYAQEQATGQPFVGPVVATQTLSSAANEYLKNKYGVYAPAGDVHGAGTQKAGDGAISMLDQALANAHSAIGGSIPTGDRLAMIDQALSLTSTPPPDSREQWEAGMNTLVTRESGWNPRAINNSDSNAAAGDPSRGLAQTTGSTFNAYHQAGTSSDIYDGVANLSASINYIKSRYGSITNVQQANANMAPQGYASGTSSAEAGWHMVGENGPEMVNFNGGEQVHSFDDIISAIKSSATGNINQVIDKFTTEIHSAVDKLGVQHSADMDHLIDTVSDQVKSFVDQAISGQKVSGEDLVSKLSLELRDFVEGALRNAGNSLTMHVDASGSSNAQDIVNQIQAQLVPKLDQLVRQGVGYNN